jgi:NADH-quinone oxidoreductase subunit E
MVAARSHERPEATNEGREELTEMMVDTTGSSNGVGASGLNRKLDALDAILAKHGNKRTALIAVLQEIQSTYRYLPEDLLTYVATALNISPATVFGVATFYAQFSLEPKGKYVVRVCDGTACHVKNSQVVLNAIRKKVKLTGSAQTTPDGLFTVETVACLGACGLAPVMVVNDQVHGQLTAEAAEIIVDELLNREVAK